MCKLFLSIDNKNATRDILTFLSQTFTTPISLDGFGIAWYGGGWHTYKNPLPYTDDVIINDLINKDTRILIGHIRHICPSCADVSYLNTHPFVYQDNLMFHNGVISDFDKNKMAQYIDPNFFKLIKGTTDSEYLFYLLLTIKQKYKKNNKLIFRTMFRKLFSILKKISKRFFANLIFCDNQYIVVTRYAWGKDASPIPLHYNKIKKGILISTEPLYTTDMISMNKIIVYCVK